jgi:molecular chaperone HscB
VDPFATLGIARSFDVDLDAIERIHRELSRALHPDKFAGGGRSERSAALAKAMEVNEAWRVVRDPIRRAEALLKLSGAGVREGEEPRPSQEFLMDMLEQREALSDARRLRDLAAIRDMAVAIEARAKDVERSLSEGFAAGRLGQGDEGGDRGVLASKIGELRFYRRLLDEVSAIEDELAA